MADDKQEPKDPEAAAREAEEKRQADIVAAVAKAHDQELPKLGGPLKNPGLGA